MFNMTQNDQNQFVNYLKQTGINNQQLTQLADQARMMGMPEQAIVQGIEFINKLQGKPTLRMGSVNN